MAGTIAVVSDRSARFPAIAAPIGKPTKFIAIETANARPVQAGSVRRWRIVKRAMSIGPFRKPLMERPAGKEQQPRPAGSMPSTAAGTRAARDCRGDADHRRDEEAPFAAAGVQPAEGQRGAHAGDPESAKTTPTSASE